MESLSPKQKLKTYMPKLYWCVFFYQTANALVLPIVPYFATSLHATNTEYSLVFTLYYIAMLFSSFTFGKIGDKFGRKIGLSISLLGITIFSLCQIFSPNIRAYILFRFLAGLFDAQTPLFQACVGDVTTQHKRAHYLSQLEAANNIAQAIGPFIGGVLSSISLSAAMWFAIGSYVISCIIAIFVLPESLPMLLERKKILNNLKEQNLPREAYEEQKKRLLYQLTVQEETTASTSSKKKKKWKFNYVMGIAIIGEFCCRWLISVFDISVAQFAEDQHNMSSFEFSMASGLGSVINTIQTGWLFNKFLGWDVSIPLITCLSGVAGAIGITICVLSRSKEADFIASLFLIAAYGFASPTAPTVMSTESSAENQGVGVAMVLLGGQTAYMTAPSVLSGLYSQGPTLPFYASYIPCGLVFISMIILHFIPGGKTAGQVPLEFALESYVKDRKMEGVDNEHEMEELTRDESNKLTSEAKKKFDNDVTIEMANLDRMKKSVDNDAPILLDHERVDDDDAFLIPPRFDSFSRSSSRTISSIISDTEKEKKEDESPEAKSDHSGDEEDMAI